MGWNDRWFAGIVGVFAGLFVFGYLVAVLAAQDGLEARDWLAAFGGMIGIAAPVGITLLITYWSTRQNDRKARRDIAETAEKMVRIINLIRDDWYAAAPTFAPHLIQGLWARFKVDLDRMTFTSSKLSSETYDQYGRRRGLEVSIRHLDKKIGTNISAFDPIDFWLLHGTDLESVKGWLEDYRAMNS